jgi:phosphocarrier protein HPr
LKKLEYKIKSRQGIHARAAVMLVREAKKYDCGISLKVKELTARAADLMEIMCLDVQWGQELTLEFEGKEEEAAYEGIKRLFEENL